MIDLSKPVCTRRGGSAKVLAVLPPEHHIDGDTVVALIDYEHDDERNLLTYGTDGLFRRDGQLSSCDLVNK